MTRFPRRLILAILLSAACHFDRGYRVMVAQPIATPITRACAASALASDVTFRTPDTVAQPSLIRDRPNTIGTFSWRSPSDTLRDVAELFQAAVSRGDTLTAETGWVGLAPTRAQIAVAESTMSARVSIVASRCGAASGQPGCVYKRTGDAPISCNAARR